MRDDQPTYAGLDDRDEVCQEGSRAETLSEDTSLEVLRKLKDIEDKANELCFGKNTEDKRKPSVYLGPESANKNNGADLSPYMFPGLKKRE